MDINIYSEPLFPTSQGIPSSSSSAATQASTKGPQSQLHGDDAVSVSGVSRISDILSDHDVDVIKSSFDDDQCAIPAECEDEEEDILEEEKSDEDEEEFCLESIITRASQIKQEFCTTGCAHFDKCLKGGLPTFGITEFFGEAGAGKTQFCLQLAITAQLPKLYGGLDSSVFYICTEGSFPSKRFAELASHIQGKFPNGAVPKTKDLMDRVFVEQANDIESLANCVEVKLPVLVRQNASDKKIRMVILDSVAGIFRHEYDDLRKRTFELRQLSQNLHEFSHEHQAAIVVSNQVTASVDLERNIASLGMAWKNMITTRIGLSKSKNPNSNLRLCTVSFSPHIPYTEIPFKITSDGLTGVGGQ